MMALFHPTDNAFVADHPEAILDFLGDKPSVQYYSTRVKD
jgi:hypothetical protein